MFIVTCFDDGHLGKQYIEDTFGEAVERACKCYTDMCKRDPDEHRGGDRLTVRDILDQTCEYTEDCWGIYIGQPEPDEP